MEMVGFLVVVLLFVFCTLAIGGAVTDQRATAKERGSRFLLTAITFLWIVCGVVIWKFANQHF